MVVVDVQTGEFDERDPLVEHRVGLPAEYLHMVPKIHQGLGEMTGVDPLAPYVGLAPIGQEGNTKGCVTRHRPPSIPGC